MAERRPRTQRRVRPLDTRIDEMNQRLDRLMLQKNIEELRARLPRRRRRPTTPVRRRRR